ncbi:unnamed protein product [Chrysoparadoxa australica]
MRSLKTCAACAIMAHLAAVRGFSISPPRVSRFSTVQAPGALSQYPPTVQRATTEAAQSATAVSPALRDAVLSVLSEVIDPDLGQDIVTLGFVQNIEASEGGSVVSFDVELTTPACPIKEQFKQDCKDLVEGLPGVERAHVTMTAQEPRPLSDSMPTGLTKVANIVAVSSCKGGVGKSTTAVNLAFKLNQLGAKVGLLDADIYGPSLPTMVKPASSVVEFTGNEIQPLELGNVKLMSYGYVNEGAAVMRGPMVSQLLQQFVGLTSWGELDYLIIDMPPGTGDIQLTLCQSLNITAAVIVTTPQRLSFTDVVKGIDMFDTVNVPSVAVVENMAYYEGMSGVSENDIQEALAEALEEVGEKGSGNLLADDAGDLREQLGTSLTRKLFESNTKKNYIFGKGHGQRLASMWGIENVVQMPLLDEIATRGDSGVPYVMANPDSKQANIYGTLAKSIVQEVAKIRFNGSGRPSVCYDAASNMIVINEGQETMEPLELRARCRCAVCVEEFTGEQLLKREDINPAIKPLNFAPIGNYALSVDWSDGHKSLYPYAAFVEAFQVKRREGKGKPLAEEALAK